MEFSNQDRTKSIKRTFNLIGVIIVAVGLIFLALKNDIGVMVSVAVFIVYVGIAQFANLCYVFFSTENGKVQIKYYPIISILKKEYEAIEFPQKVLLGFKVEKALGFTDLQIDIRTKLGVAEYPSISLSALSKVEIERIRQALSDIIGKKEVV